MKLHSYLMHEAVCARDWSAAQELLRAHFGIEIPEVPLVYKEKQDTQGIAFVESVPGYTYSWDSLSGFKSMVTLIANSSRIIVWTNK